MVVDKLLDLGKKWFKIRITKKKKKKKSISKYRGLDQNLENLVNSVGN